MNWIVNAETIQEGEIQGRKPFEEIVESEYWYGINNNSSVPDFIFSVNQLTDWSAASMMAVTMAAALFISFYWIGKNNMLFYCADRVL